MPAAHHPAKSGQTAYPAHFESVEEMMQVLNTLPKFAPQVVALTHLLRRIGYVQGGCAVPDPFCALCLQEALGHFGGDEVAFQAAYHHALAETFAALEARSAAPQQAVPQVITAA